MIDALLLLLALLGHTAIWVALVNRLHATGVPHWMVRIGTLCCFSAAGGDSGRLRLPGVFNRERKSWPVAGRRACRSAPLGVMAHRRMLV